MNFMLQIFLIVLAFILLVDNSASQIVTCNIGTVYIEFIGRQTSCTVTSINPAIVGPPPIGIFIPPVPVVAQVFYGYQQNIPFVPNNLELFMPGFIGIKLKNTQLNVLTFGELNNYPGLTIFASINNPVTSIPAGYFATNRNLRYVSFKNNRITSINNIVFDNLVSLNYLFLYPERRPCNLGNAITRNQVASLIRRLKASQC